MVAVLVVVAFAGGNFGHRLYAATHTGAVESALSSAAAGAHEHHTGHAHGHADQAAAFGIASLAGDDNTASSDHPGHSCPFAHVHSCATMALAASSCEIAFEQQPLSIAFDRAAAVAYGQFPYPPLRPPRAIA